MSVNWSSMEVQLHQSKHAPKQSASKEGVDKESKLHEQIMAYCAQKQWVCVHSRMDRATTTAKGVTDFIIGTPRGTFWVEAKAAGKKLRPEQLAFKCLVEHNKQPHLTVYSMEQFIDEIWNKIWN